MESLVNAFVFEMDIKEAVARPRIHQQLYPNSNTEYEGNKACPLCVIPLYTFHPQLPLPQNQDGVRS